MANSFLDEIVKLSKVKAVGKGLKALLKKNKKALAKEKVVAPHKGVLTGGQQRFTRSKKEIDKALSEAQGAKVHGVTYSHKRVDYDLSKGKFKYKKKTKNDVLDEILGTKTANTNVDGKSNKNINSSKKPAKVPITKGAPSVAAKNPIPKVKVNKPRVPKYAFFKGADEKITKIKAKYPPPPDSLKNDDARMAWRLDQKYHKADLKAILEHDNKHQVLQINTARLDSLPGDSLTFRQLFSGKK